MNLESTRKIVAIYFGIFLIAMIIGGIMQLTAINPAIGLPQLTPGIVTLLAVYFFKDKKNYYI